MESNIEKAVDDIKLDTVEDRIETAQKLNSALSDKPTGIICHYTG